MLTLRFIVAVGASFLLSLADAQSLADAPQCSTTCLVQAMSQPAFANQSQAQLCVDEGFNNFVGGCVQQACSVVESLTFVNITRTACGFPFSDYRKGSKATSLGMFILASAFFACRIVIKVMGYTPWGADDSLLVLAFAALIPFTVLIQYMIPQGLGLDIWVLHDYQITTFLRYLLMVQTLYIFILTIIKASILLFFLRIFPEKKFRIAVWCALAYDLFVGFIFIVFSFVQRQPTWLIWEGWRDKEPRGVILDLNKMGLVHGGMNIALDIWMLILPLTQLYKLNLKMKKKLGIMAMFSVGIFLTVVSIIRLHSLIPFATSANATADARGTTIWSAIEICTGIVVACMPNARQILREAGRQIKNASLSLTNRTHSTNSGSQRIFQDQSLELRVAVNSRGPISAPTPTDKSSYSSTTPFDFGRKNSSFTSDAETAT
ncbi:hypothetical protein CORC01_13142 [Colletotrichum orchidophilum]|uniref:Uncharacterized protein n=1 Tax=Colletotrichum orchidophilum TaxID=1209926 RepID=A0A1G4AR17_9PEZI|nr:uncharacterized protein CORC01_13142 [Colletotrichum orchidophilum]OHE91545.1 hypothetical protein CORC01_13142 [Colletotrichum orchidophilum]